MVCAKCGSDSHRTGDSRCANYCTLCAQPGHQQKRGTCLYRVCSTCGESGHSARECTSRTVESSTVLSGSSVRVTEPDLSDLGMPLPRQGHWLLSFRLGLGVVASALNRDPRTRTRRRVASPTGPGGEAGPAGLRVGTRHSVGTAAAAQLRRPPAGPGRPGFVRPSYWQPSLSEHSHGPGGRSSFGVQVPLVLTS
jgi:hypothetical protein